MQYKVMKDTDLKLSNICLGGAGFGNGLNEIQSFEILDAFVRGGGNFIDTANVYCRWVPGLDNCSEQVLGKWLKARGAYNDVVIATKGGHYDFGRKDIVMRVSESEIRADLEDSLKTLGLDVIDFYWLHRDDAAKPIEEIIDVLEKLRGEGKIRFYGLSNYQTERLEQAKQYLASKGLCGPYAVSNQWSMASVNSGENTGSDPTLVMFDDCEYQWHKKSQVPVVPFTSTAQGFFEKLRKADVVVKNGQIVSKGNFEQLHADMCNMYLNEDNLKKYEHLLNLQKETGQSLQTLALAWLIRQPFQVFPVCGVSRIEQMKDLLAAGDVG